MSFPALFCTKLPFVNHEGIDAPRAARHSLGHDDRTFLFYRLFYQRNPYGGGGRVTRANSSKFPRTSPTGEVLFFWGQDVGHDHE